MEMESGLKSPKKGGEKRAVERNVVFNTQAYIKTGISSESGLTDLFGVVLNLSSQGCCVVLHSDFIPEVFSFCRVTIGNHILVMSQIRWVEEIEPGLFKIGIRYQI